jgi:hypothetical protein
MWFGKTLKRISNTLLESLGPYEGKQHKPWLDDECSQFLDQRKQAKMQLLQDQDQNNVDNL